MLSERTKFTYAPKFSTDISKENDLAVIDIASSLKPTTSPTQWQQMSCSCQPAEGQKTHLSPKGTNFAQNNQFSLFFSCGMGVATQASHQADLWLLRGGLPATHPI